VHEEEEHQPIVRIARPARANQSFRALQAREASPVTARTFDPEHLDRSELLGPRQEPLIPRPRRGELDLTESSPELIKRHRHVQVAGRGVYRNAIPA
jgi:hypothetical protein